MRQAFTCEMKAQHLPILPKPPLKRLLRTKALDLMRLSMSYLGINSLQG